MDNPIDIRIVSSVITYRTLAKELITPQDAVLEIGCSSGEATRVLAATAKRVVAVDVSDEIIDPLKLALADCPTVTVEKIDGRDTGDLRLLIAAPDAIFIDIGGNATLDNCALVVRLCLRAFAPRIMVVRNQEIAEFASQITGIEPPESTRIRRNMSHDPLQFRLDNLLDLSRSRNKENRSYAARKLLRMQEPEARARLREMMKDPVPYIQRICKMAIERDDGSGVDGSGVETGQ